VKQARKAAGQRLWEQVAAMISMEFLLKW